MATAYLQQRSLSLRSVSSRRQSTKVYAGAPISSIPLPSVQYHTELDGITPATVQRTVQSVFTYGGLEIASFVALVVVIQRTIGLRALYHLAFVLETQMALVQSKLTVWMLLTLTFRVVHYGYDFTFDFPWIKSKLSSTSE
ncbi:hypothetical protein PF005_g4278 [Phytophthora fragariae]|uniref:Uncharacterized protein n=1 Tax=Phytophthora fragariae TaxID=53985 RepID=A0A6A3UZ58_9STRA|nr:hypothetical protein PF003_g32834 [Phytophthora fragariae]KAE9024829.1 hypothetical protein PF011_g3315 [Phytophthora fragariae]KAE9130772.1 hypothetical protein PF007_g4375 [Phytophthora fragariae]KAE9131350.1 hypothetical protein PF010_g3526 [Phytophthora fragariae]KAE9152186.1 hypothetical protein PF006_g3572 [Phytophthora fragariae]